MQMNQVQDSLNRIEQCADDAMAALRSSGGGAPDDLRQQVTEMHRQAREVRNMAQQAGDQSRIVGSVDTLEQTGDRAKQACGSVGNVDPQLKQAVMRAHDEISSLKKQLH